MSTERQRLVAERVMRIAETANPRRDGESPFAWRMRQLIWTMTTPEGQAAFKAAQQAREEES